MFIFGLVPIIKFLDCQAPSGPLTQITAHAGGCLAARCAEAAVQTVFGQLSKTAGFYSFILDDETAFPGQVRRIQKL